MQLVRLCYLVLAWFYSYSGIYKPFQNSSPLLHLIQWRKKLDCFKSDTAYVHYSLWLKYWHPWEHWLWLPPDLLHNNRPAVSCSIRALSGQHSNECSPHFNIEILKTNTKTPAYIQCADSKLCFSNRRLLKKDELLPQGKKRPNLEWTVKGVHS